MTNETKNKNVFDNFTKKYSLSKTLRFELKPVGKTREWMNKNLQFDEKLQTFLKDQVIEDAYQTLKPIFDKIHEEFITKSLESEKAKQINFSLFLGKYKNRKDIIEAEIQKIEKELREQFFELYKEPVNEFKRIAGKDKKKNKNILEKNNYEILTEKGILTYIERNIDKYIDIKPKNEIQKALNDFSGFFTYFTGFNQNRKNYYEIKKEASTAVATRVVSENLPKFCDNLIAFNDRKEEYLKVYDFLKNKGKILQNKDGNPLLPINKDIFDISCFSECLSQKQIENYNEQISNANYLINLYNQEKNKENNFKKLLLFKTLYKQIGCGTRKSLFFTLTHSNKKEANKAQEEGKVAFSVEEIFELAKKAGDKYFAEDAKNEEIKTVNDFIKYVKNKENYLGVYWSQVALNTISNKYFSNWYTLKEELVKEKIFKKGKGGDEEDIKIPSVVELEGFFAVLDKNKNWQDKGVLFRDNIFDDENKKYLKEIIFQEKSPSKALLSAIFIDLEKHAKDFISQSEEIFNLNNYSDEKNTEKIKKWLDNAIATSRILKYFSVRESKIKGDPIDPMISEGLNILLRSDDAVWFKWYDAVRNFLTKKPQDDVKENKLKLNFENTQLLGGWPDGQEKVKGAVLLKKDSVFYLGILKKRNIFDTKKKDNLIYKDLTKNAGRMILVNLPFKTLAGKGFKNLFGEKYSDMGRREPLKAIKLLKQFIKDQYVDKYSMLQKILDTNYSEKNKFDQDIIKILKEMYACDFKPINWDKVEESIKSGELYLFQIKCGEKKIQSLYWNHVFAKDSLIQLAGQGELFYRRVAIKDRKIKKGYKDKPWVIENRRFTEEKFLYHQSLKVNYKEKSYGKPIYAISEINNFINNELINDENICFLGIDRGEKNLAYYSLVDKNGNIIEQDTLNMPFLDKNGNQRIIKTEKKMLDKNGNEKIEQIDCRDYNDLLDARAGNRDYARKNWQVIGTIKELKDGYISQVVRKITDLAIDNQAFIILENLSKGFMRGRQKIEKSVYQKLELALAKKLNFVVDKKAKAGEIGSVVNALQLTPPVNNFGDLENRKQFGIMFYVKADYTSQTDPVTGWRKKIYLKKGSEDYIKKQIIDNFNKIGFDGKDYYFEYTVDYLDPVNKKSKCKKTWTLYSGKNGVELDRFFREDIGEKKWSSKKQEINKILDKLFENFKKDNTILEQIKQNVKLTKVNERTAWETFRFTINLIQQIRNTGLSKGEEDFILSPVRDEKGNHFDSRRTDKNKWPTSGDGNGAYNIAKKGIIMAEHIKRELSPFIRDDEWDAWLAGEKIWNKWLEENKKNLFNKWNRQSKSQK